MRNTKRSHFFDVLGPALTIQSKKNCISKVHGLQVQDEMCETVDVFSSVWMTLILAGIVSSSYSFAAVIAPSPRKLNNIRCSNSCYDSDCVYGEYQCTYYFSSIQDSSHCRNKFEIYNHPTRTVQFPHTTQCYPSLKSLDSSTPDWQLNDSIIFYVNRERTEWIESSEHHKQIERNLSWISIILTFVGCLRISMICGFITMYFKKILLCSIDCCRCDYCNKYIDDDEDYNQTIQNDIENRNSTSSNTNNNRQQQLYNKIHPENNNKNNKFQPIPINHQNDKYIIVVIYLKCFIDLFYSIQRGIVSSTLDFELDSSNKLYAQPVIGQNAIIDEPLRTNDKSCGDVI